MGSVFSGFAYFTMRKINTQVNSTVTTFYFGLFSCIMSFSFFAIAPAQIIREQANLKSIGLLLSTGLFGWLA